MRIRHGVHRLDIRSVDLRLVRAKQTLPKGPNPAKKVGSQSAKRADCQIQIIQSQYVEMVLHKDFGPPEVFMAGP